VNAERQCACGQDHARWQRAVGYTTGDIDIHDTAVDGSGRVVFVNSLFGCLATTSETHSFAPLWKPPFITKLAAEDRCHLNGLALKESQPKYVTAVSQTDVADGWRDRRHDGGCVIDVETNQIVCDGLSMPLLFKERWGRLPRMPKTKRDIEPLLMKEIPPCLHASGSQNVAEKTHVADA